MDSYFITFFVGCVVGGLGLFLALMFDVGMGKVLKIINSILKDLRSK